MALGERQSVSFDIDQYGNVSVRTTTEIVRDGRVVGSAIERRMIDVDAGITEEDKRTRAIVEAARTNAKATSRRTEPR